jgi:hypothetical protein
MILGLNDMKNRKCATKYCRNYARADLKICNKCHMRQYKKRHPINYYYNVLRNNAKRRGKEFELTLDDFKKFCKETNYIELKGKEKNSATIDRINHKKGYTIDNIRILSLSDNSKKGNYEKNCPF